MPEGRNLRSVISPMGSARATICSSPSAMVATAFSERARRSSMAASMPAARAASISSRFAAINLSWSRRMASAMASSALFLVLVSAFAIRREAAREFQPRLAQRQPFVDFIDFRHLQQRTLQTLEGKPAQRLSHQTLPVAPDFGLTKSGHHIHPLRLRRFYLERAAQQPCQHAEQCHRLYAFGLEAFQHLRGTPHIASPHGIT